MAVLITGATGLIGRAVAKSFLEDRETVHVLTRDKERARAVLGDGVKLFSWQPADEDLPEGALDGASTVLHLMGEHVGGRWSKAKVDRIYQSRVTSAKKLAQAVRGKPCRFISASSFGIYSGRRNETYDETDSLGAPATRIQSILQAAENAVASAASSETKVNMVRFGMVCAKDGYPKKLVRLFEKGMGFLVGDGEQIVPIVDIDDAVAMLRWVAAGQAGEGPVNCVAPRSPRFKEVAHAIAVNTNSVTRMSIPPWLARPLLGGSADYFLLSYDVRPRKALDRGYNFRHSDSGQILRRAILGT
jgi:uncharacterized protein (TIGR01777 family)